VRYRGNGTLSLTVRIDQTNRESKWREFAENREAFCEKLATNLESDMEVQAATFDLREIGNEAIPIREREE
jgi:hypothetical protein